MIFTNDDLDRVRKYTKRGDILWEALCGMLARLEAAEKCAEQFAGSCCVEDGIVQAWREAAGK